MGKLETLNIDGINDFSKVDKIIKWFYGSVPRYKNPIFICNYITRLEIVSLRDSNGQCIYDPNFQSKYINGRIFGIDLCIDNSSENGLFIGEKNI